ncbi:hypothetical protein PH210_25365 [Paenibacillus sp. BSR1-1]|uniref:hypothetical protein n=1 Tax=Paenibacillus sp. BSR1-1 TaxID=3020845 RepID=UPI0025AF49A2|nr:hypothetical protein [Paenibacillus sp. BSR1-1]MDN3019497.1 hypothetical protein [Paenibacillus sp. BSR1-1]
MKLPMGVTGFYEKLNEPPKIDEKQFKQFCFNIIINNGGKVLEFKAPQEETNFFDVKVNVFNKHLHILMNAHYPFLAFASDVNFGEVNFINEPQLYKQFSSFYYVLGTKELNEPLLTEQNELNSAELKQLAYWKPERIGDVIFNHWD